MKRCRRRMAHPAGGAQGCPLPTLRELSLRDRCHPILTQVAWPACWEARPWAVFSVYSPAFSLSQVWHATTSGQRVAVTAVLRLREPFVALAFYSGSSD